MAMATTEERFDALEGEIEVIDRALNHILERPREADLELPDIDDMAAGNLMPNTLYAAGENDQALAAAIVALRGPRIDAPCDPGRCDWVNRRGHDLLLELFSPTSPERTEALLRLIRTWDEMPPPNIDIFPLDWPEFASEHRWVDPRSTRWIAAFAQELYGLTRTRIESAS